MTHLYHWHLCLRGKLVALFSFTRCLLVTLKPNVRYLKCWQWVQCYHCNQVHHFEGIRIQSKNFEVRDVFKQVLVEWVYHIVAEAQDFQVVKWFVLFWSEVSLCEQNDINYVENKSTGMWLGTQSLPHKIIILDFTLQMSIVQFYVFWKSEKVILTSNVF